MPDWLLTREWSLEPEDIEDCGSLPDWAKADLASQHLVAGNPKSSPSQAIGQGVSPTAKGHALQASNESPAQRTGFTRVQPETIHREGSNKRKREDGGEHHSDEKRPRNRKSPNVSVASFVASSDQAGEASQKTVNPPKAAMKPAFPEPSKLDQFDRFYSAWKAETAAQRLLRARHMGFNIVQYDEWCRNEVERVEAEERRLRQLWNKNTPTTEGTLVSKQTWIEGSTDRIVDRQTHTNEDCNIEGAALSAKEVIRGETRSNEVQPTLIEKSASGNPAREELPKEQPARNTDLGPSTVTSTGSVPPDPRTCGIPEESVSEVPKKRKRNVGKQEESIGKHDRTESSLSQAGGTKAGKDNPAKIRKVSHIDTSMASSRPKRVQTAENPKAQQPRKRKRDLDTRETSDSKRTRPEVPQQEFFPDRDTRRLNRERVKAQAERKGLRASTSQGGRVLVHDPTLDVLASSPLLQLPVEPPEHADKSDELTVEETMESSETHVAGANVHSLQPQNGPVKTRTGARKKQGRPVLNATVLERAKPIQGQRGRRAPIPQKEHANTQHGPLPSPRQSIEKRGGERTKGGRVSKKGRQIPEKAGNPITKGSRRGFVKTSTERQKKLAEAVSPTLQALIEEPRRTRSQKSTSFAALDTKGQTAMAPERRSQRVREKSRRGKD